MNRKTCWTDGLVVVGVRFWWICGSGWISRKPLWKSATHIAHNQFNIKYLPYANAFNQWNSKEQQIKQQNYYCRYVQYSNESQCFPATNTLGTKLSWKKLHNRNKWIERTHNMKLVRCIELVSGLVVMWLSTLIAAETLIWRELPIFVEQF